MKSGLMESGSMRFYCTITIFYMNILHMTHYIVYTNGMRVNKPINYTCINVPTHIFNGHRHNVITQLQYIICLLLIIFSLRTRRNRTYIIVKQ